ncbi:MAG: acyl-CoA dehydrogenase family protein [Ilumatobacter sp.]|uniref:acyl-CoA dehydrogenase family protein n=1 Tax=Ilumatobacter sp. TaxID=1967498 RepID=UPI002637DEC8|nr:acyl-CoA dehydrogenase family protein [Ilumatobacter sp.]MDJ0767498.1 acyl-CoA dehydrogenase family protein [Ilumatobacter sp.]
MDRTPYDDAHEMFRASFRTFLDREVVPHHERWEREGIVDRDLYRRAGEAGFLGFAAPAEYGGGDAPDFRFNMVVLEELCDADVLASGFGITLHNDVCLPYFLAGDDEQRARWLPGICSGELVTAIAMTEPGIGSDLASMTTTAIRDGDDYVVNGAKTFITNGIVSDVVIVACKTDPSQQHRGMSLLVIEKDRDGFTIGRNLDKLGLHAQDTAELFFSDVRVPVENRLGDEGTGFVQLVSKLPQERLSLAAAGLAHAESAFGRTLEYVKERQAFGRPIGSFQNSRFKLAEMRTELDIGWAFVDRQIEQLNAGTLSAEDAAESKWWCTELQQRVLDTCLQLHGGYGYMNEYSIARAYADGRVQTIYGGTTEIMKEIIGKSLGV